MREKALYLLALFDQETQSTLAGYHEVLMQNGLVGQQTKDIPYHFTLGSRGLDTEDVLAERLERACEETASIDITMAHIGLFGLGVLFIAPNMNFELLGFQKRFFPECGNGYHPWAAHATILMDEPDGIIKAIPLVAGCFRPFHARIDSVALYEFFPPRHVKTCALSETS